MTRTALTRLCLPLLLALLNTGCGSLLESRMAAPQTFVLRLPPQPVDTGAAPSDAALRLGSVQVHRPEAGPGLNTDRIALLRSAARFDFYAASRWAAATPDLVESVVVDALRGTGLFAAVYDDAAPFAPRYDLRVTLRRFEADYTAGGDNRPTVFVVLDCTLGRRRDRQLLASFTAQGSAPAGSDTLSAVVAAFEAASAAAVADLLDSTRAAIGAERPAASEGR
jgi:cholesterol transport system auxiliary component